METLEYGSKQAIENCLKVKKNEKVIIITDENSNKIGEFAIGTNIALKKIIGNLLQDEKFPGVHIAYGDPYTAKTGAKWNIKAHYDGVIRNTTIIIDSEKIMENGKYLI
tara:strand:- start:52952 stop:53278 length:327 start_codon:yes stop_codon:yes gene_type:complete